MRGRRVAVTGAGGQLGRELVRAFGDAGAEVLALAREDLDITRRSDLDRLTAWRPEIVINSAAWTNVDGCAGDPERATLINGVAAGEVASAAASVGALIVQISSNEVFDGTSQRPYHEDDEPRPINPYGASKLAGEVAVARANDRHLIVRTAWLYGAGDRNFPGKIRHAAARALEERKPLLVVFDEWGNPTDVRWLAPAIRRLSELALAGTATLTVYHLAGEPPASRLDWARAVLRESPVRIEPVPLAEFRRASEVPKRAVLNTTRARDLGIAAHRWRTGIPV